MPSSPSDDQLFQRAQILSRFFCNKFYVRDRDDIFQEVCIALLKARRKYDPSKGHWDQYSYVWANGAVLDYLGRQIPREQRELPLDDLRDGAHDDYTHVYTADLLQQLPLRLKFIALCLMRGYKQSEIAQMFGVTEGRISKHVLRLQAESEKYSHSLH